MQASHCVHIRLDLHARSQRRYKLLCTASIECCCLMTIFASYFHLQSPHTAVPVLFRNELQGRELLPTSAERVGIYRQLATYMKVRLVLLATLLQLLSMQQLVADISHLLFHQQIRFTCVLFCVVQAHFGDDAWGKRKAFYFLPWHFAFFCR
jgi:hypothetical protein